MLVHFLTHPEVEIDPELPVTDWCLSERGRERAMLVAQSLPDVSRIVTSPEAKADQTAHLIGDALDAPVALAAGLAEIDRSATGYLPEPAFWANYQEFLERPSQSAKGWEPAELAQQRIVATVQELTEDADDTEVLVLVSHGGVGALLLAHLTETPIQRLEDQPGQGSHFSFDSLEWSVRTSWRSFEQLT